MNKVIIYGSIGEPKFRDVNTKNGTREVCSFGICQPEGKDASGKSVFAWYNVDFWLDKDSKLKPYIVKGQRVIVEGELKTERWTKDGVERSAIKIMARNLTLTGGKQDQAPVEEEDESGDLPF